MIALLCLCAVPVNLHIGNMGLASSYAGAVDSVPPAIHGGNVDDRRIGKGATMYYPVQVGTLSYRACSESTECRLEAVHGGIDRAS